MCDLDRGALDLPASMFRRASISEEVDYGVLRKGEMRYVPGRFVDLDGQAILEGDICLGRAGDIRRQDGRGIGTTGKLWEGGCVPFEIGSADPVMVSDAIAHWRAKTPIRFVERSTEKDFVVFEDTGSCWSQVGCAGDVQILSLGGPYVLGSAIHEIGHLLGLWHEQSRADRDQHVTVLYDNIYDEDQHNFDRHVLDASDIGDYDFGSIMHYPATAFSKNGEPTIIVHGGQSIGQRKGLSAGDIAAARKLYPGLAWPP